MLPDGRIVSGSWDKTVRVWDTATGQCVGIFEKHTGVGKYTNLSPDIYMCTKYNVIAFEIDGHAAERTYSEWIGR